MSTSVIVVIVVVGVLVIGAVVTILARAAKRRRQLREHFGPEYEGLVEQTGNQRKAQAVLQKRVESRDRLDIRPLDPIERDRYAQEWREVQAGFVDAPERSLAAADALVTRVMQDSGYPVDDFDQRAAMVSVDHPEVVRHYRAAHEIFLASRDDKGLSTEHVRQAVVAYRSLFSELLRPADSHAASNTRRDGELEP